MYLERVVLGSLARNVFVLSSYRNSQGMAASSGFSKIRRRRTPHPFWSASTFVAAKCRESFVPKRALKRVLPTFFIRSSFVLSSIISSSVESIAARSKLNSP